MTIAIIIKFSIVSTTPLQQWFFWTTLRDKPCWQPIAVMGVVDTFRPALYRQFSSEAS